MDDEWNVGEMRWLAVIAHQTMPIRVSLGMEKKKFRCALSDGKTIFMSKSQHTLYESETGCQRLLLLTSMPVVKINMPIEVALKKLDVFGNPIK